MPCRIIALALFSVLAVQAAAQSPVPDRRAAIIRDVDLIGTDLQALFDTSFKACRTACLSNPDCTAFTYNSGSRACFPKRDVHEETGYEGAVSGEILATDLAVLDAAEARAADLEFLSVEDLREARELAIGIGSDHPAGQWGISALLKAAQDSFARGDTRNAMRWTGAAVSRSDASDQWTDYARLTRAIDAESTAERTRRAGRALHAAANAYIRGGTDGARVNALLEMGRALERLGRGKDTVSALRLAENITPRADVIAELKVAAGKYGFRITGHSTENEAEAPRICAEFSGPLVKAGTDYAPFVQLPDPGLVVQAGERQLCIDGVEHGERYTVTFRKGLPAASGEALLNPVELSFYVRDRSPSVAFPGRAFVLPRAAGAALPVETVNLDALSLTLRRVSDRNLLRTMQEDYFARPLGRHDLARFSSDIAEEVWTGTGEVGNELNRTMTTRLPLDAAMEGLDPGIYALTARPAGMDRDRDAAATQWFVLTDLGMTTLKGTDGLHVFLRGLSDAEPLDDVELTLFNRANSELATARTDARGHARFPPGLLRGEDGSAPALVMARRGVEDMAFLSLTEPAFDLSDRGVEGRAPAPPVDVFLTTDRGAYRAGEVIHATALARDGNAGAVPGLPLTAILTRPDGVEYARHLSSDDVAGGHVFSMPLGADVPRGTWRLDIKADPGADALASANVLVEDFLPERIEHEISLPGTPVAPGDTVPLTLQARYLFGGPGAGLRAEGNLRMEPRRRLEGFPGYLFGRHDARAAGTGTYIEGGETDSDGRLELPLSLPETAQGDRPYEARITMRVREGSGRPVERVLTRMLSPAGPMIGIRPAFDDVVPRGSPAEFRVMGIGPDLGAKPMQVRWIVNRVNTRYQWYRQYGNWNWEPVTTRTRVATGKATLGDGPATISAGVGHGRHELVVERLDGEYVSASVEFDSGWYAPAEAGATPDNLDLSLDRQDYSAGDTAKLRLVPRHGGIALVTVLTNRVIDMKAVPVSEGENTVTLPVTEEWGAGAYVTAQVIRPMDVPAGRNPARSLGLAYAPADPGDRQLDVSIEAPETVDPRGPLAATVRVGGLEEGQPAHVTLAAVDLGILNLTRFKSPDPSAHYFGQRRLGVEIRDLYGRLIDGMNGAEGRVRSGGDAGAVMEMQATPPTDELVAFFSGPLSAGSDGSATARFDIPDFNGTVRLMAVAWSARGVGQAERDVIVRDPVVVSASLPRFLAPGDQSRLLLEITHAEGPAGRMGLDVSAGAGLELGDLPPGIDLTPQETARLSVAVTAGAPGDHPLRVALTTPDGRQLTKTLTLPVRRNDPPVSRTRRITLAPGDTLTLDTEVFAGLRVAGAEAVISAGPLARLDVPGLLRSLDRYPYGCTEQVTSRAMPLLYLNEVAQTLGMGDDAAIRARIDKAIARVLTRQSGNGAFGLWRAGSGDFWLDAYVADFLSRARAEGHQVPDRAFAMAMDNLRNRVNYAPDFDSGGESIAYALMVLAREGAARIGDLRYFADVKGDAFATPLATAQLATALASYGDQTRADRLFRRATAQLSEPSGTDRAQRWRADYGTSTRDRAGLLALLTEAGSDAADPERLADDLAVAGPRMSTQEQAWTLLAARALIDAPGTGGLTLDGTPITGPFVRALDGGMPHGRAIRNISDRETGITLTTTGVPLVPRDPGGYGYRIERSYHDIDGNPVTPDAVQTGTRLVTVITVRPFEEGGGRLIIDDPLPAGLEIDNPNLLRSGDVRALDWLDPAEARHAEFRSERFLAAVDWRGDDPFHLAYVVRAVTPGEYHHPAVTVEDMYRPRYRAHGATGAMRVIE